MAFQKSGICSNCKVSTSWILHLQLFANGSENFLWACSKCNTRNPGRSNQFYVPSKDVRSYLTEEQILALPVIVPQLYNRCGRCGNRTAELHHWAPKSIFGADEAENWPKDYLCKDCHDQWHRMVTPQIV